MNLQYDESPIIACSSGSNSNVAISVIRISGINSFAVVSKFFSLKGSSVEPRKAYFCKLLDLQKTVIDEVVFTYFNAPHSYNGENILELSVHGNKRNVQKIIKIFIDSGVVRASEPGEFTLRALKNGKLNLSQVEGLDMLLNASSDFALDQGMNLLNGELFESFNDLHDKFVKLKASLELGIDFSEDVGEEQFLSQLNNNFAIFLASVKKTLSKDSLQKRQSH